MKALIFCAGRGERLRPLTDTVPKPLIEVAGQSMALRQILALKKAGITSFVINTAHLSSSFKEHLGDGSQWGVQIQYSEEGLTSQDALETLGGIAKALPLLTENGEKSFIAVAGDIVTDYPYGKFVQKEKDLSRSASFAHLVLVPNPAYHREGDFGLTPKGQLTRQNKAYTYSSLGVFSVDLFKSVEVKRAKLFPWINPIIDQGLVSAELYQGHWFNVGDQKELEKVEKYLNKKVTF